MGGKTQRYCYNGDQIGILGKTTSRGSRGAYEAKPYEMTATGQLDHLHRLAKMGCRPETIAKYTGLPLESVEYVLIRNNYPQAEDL